MIKGRQAMTRLLKIVFKTLLFSFGQKSVFYKNKNLKIKKNEPSGVFVICFRIIFQTTICSVFCSKKLYGGHVILDFIVFHYKKRIT